MFTYDLKAGDKTLRVKALKADVKRLKNALHRIVKLHLYFRELTGVIGESDSSSILYSPFGGNTGEIVDKEAYQKDLDEFFASQPDPIVDVNAAIAATNVIFNRHLPVVDNRRTKEVDEQAKADAARFMEEREAKRMEWVDQNCMSREKVSWQDWKMPVCLEITYDNSEPMTDYFDTHHRHGETMLLATVKKQAQTERLCRSVLDCYPELAALEWTWHTENYSMGHGNYLISEWAGVLEDVKTTYGEKSPSFRYEIRCAPYEKSLYAYKNYPGTKEREKEKDDKESDYLSGGFRVENAAVAYEGDWTWIFFPGQPSKAIRDALVALGGRFGRRRSRRSGTSGYYIKRRVPVKELEKAILGAELAMESVEDGQSN